MLCKQNFQTTAKHILADIKPGLVRDPFACNRPKSNDICIVNRPGFLGDSNL